MLDNKKTIVKMLGIRGKFIEPLPEYIEVLQYASKYLNLGNLFQNTVEQMLNEYYEGLHKYKPSPWTMTAEVISLLYVISRKLDVPQLVDIKLVIKQLQSHKNRLISQDDRLTVEKSVILLQFLHDNLHKITYHKPSASLEDSDDEF